MDSWSVWLLHSGYWRGLTTNQPHVGVIKAQRSHFASTQISQIEYCWDQHVASYHVFNEISIEDSMSNLWERNCLLWDVVVHPHHDNGIYSFIDSYNKWSISVWIKNNPTIIELVSRSSIQMWILSVFDEESHGDDVVLDSNGFFLNKFVCFSYFL